MEGSGRGDDWLAEQGELDWVHDLRGADAPVGPPGRAPERPRAERRAVGGAAAVGRRRRILALGGVALVIVVAVVVVVVTSGGGGSPARSPSAAPAESAVTAPTTTPTRRAPRVSLPAAGHLSRGDSGAGVIVLQKALIALGYEAGTPDGTFGPTTEAAVVAFQKAKGLTPDGAVGSKTAQALNQALASKNA